MARLFALVGALLVLVVGPSATLAQVATPVAAQDATLADSMGLPELAITATDAGFEGVPAETGAGRYVLTFTNNTSVEAAVAFAELTEGKTPADLALETRPEDAPSGPDATPGAGMAETPMAGMDEGSPAAEQEDPFAFLYENHQPGGIGALPGQTVQGIIDLRSGDYGVWADDPESPISAVAMTVTGDLASPAAMAEPVAAVTVRETGAGGQGYAFGVEGTFASGPQVIEVVNDSDQPHFMLLLRSPRPITIDQLMALLNLPEDAPPPADLGFNPDEIVNAAYAAGQSAGTTQWLAANLEPGYYIIACFIPDPLAGGIPHAVEGMIDIITVGDVGTPTP